MNEKKCENEANKIILWPFSPVKKKKSPSCQEFYSLGSLTKITAYRSKSKSQNKELFFSDQQHMIWFNFVYIREAAFKSELLFHCFVHYFLSIYFVCLFCYKIVTKCHKFFVLIEQDLESCWWTPYQRLFTGQDGRHSGRAGGGAGHRHGLPFSVTIAPCWPAEAPRSAADALLSALKSKPSTVLTVGAVCVCVCMRECVCVTRPLLQIHWESVKISTPGLLCLRDTRVSGRWKQ